jgi:hypothetical protein
LFNQINIHIIIDLLVPHDLFKVCQKEQRAKEPLFQKLSTLLVFRSKPLVYENPPFSSDSLRYLSF